MSASQVDGVRELARTAAGTAGLVLEDVTISSAGRRRVVRIVVDLPEDQLGGVPMDAVASASQAISAALDASPVLGQAPYVLEVSSPGVDRPLTERRHWLRARRRLVSVRLTDGGQATGRLGDVDDEGLSLAASAGPIRLAWAQVARGAVQVDFSGAGGDEAEALEADAPDMADIEDSTPLDDDRPAGEDRPTGPRGR
ncbi:MAG: ribosome maturation factor RimP [Kineosporiaceae bacterium]|nr:ribosome maturation factor RimP [Kineosporiaceae bacterium]MBK7625315.1 ribosome maturation factor RimP [Kineosporiaceae bacterium]MBK8076324.1 ribosome maturation factor RimP [Kineosporiaceae bacterium]